MRTLGVKGISRVDGAQQSANPLQCSVPHTATDSAGKPALAKGIGPVTFNRSSKQYVTDFEGQLRPVYDGCAGIEGSRIVTNWLTESADFASANWAVAGGAVKNGGGSFTLPTNGAYFQHDINTSVFTPFNTGRVIRQTCKMSVLIGSGLIQLRPVGKNSPFTLYGTKNITLTSTPKVFSMLFTVTDECGGYKLRILGNDGANTQTVLIEWGQAEDVTGQSNQAPGEYVPTTSAPVTQCFAYANPFTLDGNGAVTDSGVRTLLPAIKGILLEPSTTNKCTSYSVIPGDTYQTAVTSGAVLTLGKKYEIVTRTTTDFTTKGAASNTVGTQFVLSSACTLGAGDSVKEVTWAVGTKSFYSGSFIQNISGLTLSGDTAAVLSIVDDTAALQAAGLYATTGAKVYKLDNSAGVGFAYASASGTTGNTTVNGWSMQARVRGGTGGVFDMSNGSNNADVTAQANYTLFKKEGFTPGASGSFMGVGAGAGQVLYFILNQLEESPFATSPVIVQNAAATRAATVESLPSAGNIKGNDFTVYLEFQTPITPTVVNRLFAWYADANNRGGVYFDGTVMSAMTRVTGITQADNWTHTVVPNILYKVVAVFSATGIKLFVNGALRATYTGALATNVLSAASIRLGSQGDDTGFLKGNIKTFQIFRQVFSDAKCISMTQ